MFAILTARSMQAVSFAVEVKIKLDAQSKLQFLRSRTNPIIPDKGKGEKMLDNNGISTLRRVFLVVLIIVGATLIVGCGPKSDELALSFVEAVNTKDSTTAMNLLSEDVLFTFGEQDALEGKEAVQAWLTGLLGQNLKIEAENAEVVDGVVVFKTSASWTQLQTYHIDSLSGVTEVTIENGQITTYNFKLDDESLVMLPTPIERSTELMGDWQRAKTHPGMGEIFLRFNSDNTYRQAIGEAEKLDSSPMVEGTFEFEVGKFVITNENLMNENYLWGCEESTMIGEYTISRLSNNNIILEVVDDECHGRDDNIAAEYKPVE